MLKNKITIKKMCLSAVIAGLCYVFTMFISLPISSTGYINLSDFFIVFTTIAIDPICGLMVAIIAPSLADLTMGYYLYVPFTIIAKSLEVLLSYLLFNKIHAKIKYILIYISGIVMAIVYLLPDLIILGFDQILVGLINILINSFQGVVGITLALIFYQIFKKINFNKKLG